MAGAFDDGAWRCAEVVLDGRATCSLLYTDGVLDTVGTDERFGAERLRATLEPQATVEPSVLVAQLAHALEPFRHGPQRDDTAIVAVRFLGGVAE